MRSVELLLDADGDAAVRRAWAALMAADLPSAGRHSGATNAPHITLAVCPGEASGGVADAARLAGLAATLPRPVELSGLVLFGGGDRRVLACHVGVDEAMLRLQRDVVARLGGAGGVLAQTAPGAWTPHVTLARRMPLARLATALEVCGPVDLRVEAVAMRGWDSVAKRVTVVA